MSSLNNKNTSGGFSLLELLIAMVITMALMTAASDSTRECAAHTQSRKSKV